MKLDSETENSVKVTFGV